MLNVCAFQACVLQTSRFSPRASQFTSLIVVAYVVALVVLVFVVFYEVYYRCTSTKTNMYTKSCACKPFEVFGTCKLRNFSERFRLLLVLMFFEMLYNNGKYAMYFFFAANLALFKKFVLEVKLREKIRKVCLAIKILLSHLLQTHYLVSLRT